MSIQVTGVDDVTREVTRIMKTVTGPDMSYRVAMAGSRHVLKTYYFLTYPNKQNRKIHYFYDEAVMRGNWSESIQELSLIRKRLRDSGLAIVGPRYNRKRKSTSRKGKRRYKRRPRIIGQHTHTSWANYAHMIYGSARAYYQRITMQALTQSAPAALPAMLNESKKIFNQATGRV